MHGDIRAQKIAKTMRARNIDNFSVWREKMRIAGKFGLPTQALHRSGDLAEFIGVVLGDGNISAFPRTERLLIACDLHKPGFVARYTDLTRKLFSKEPTVTKMKDINCIRISLYQKGIAKRLGLPTGNRAHLVYQLPQWIVKSRPFRIRFLRGLYEAEGSYSIHKPTYTYKLLFSNKNKSLLDIVYDGILFLGFHPHRSSDKIQLSRREEIEQCLSLLKFRNYGSV